MANRLCRAINAAPFVVKGCAAPLDVTISIGAIVGGQGERQLSSEELFSAADRALYEAKNAGRNQAVIKGLPQSAAA